MSETQPEVVVAQNSAEELVKRSAACVETRNARNTCVTERGQENCQQLVEAHKECMRKMGFEAN